MRSAAGKRRENAKDWPKKVGAARWSEAEETLRANSPKWLPSFDWPNLRDGVVPIPPEYVTEALSLLIVVDPPVSEEMIEAKEEVVKSYRENLGIPKWRQIYAVEVREADRADIERLRDEGNVSIGWDDPEASGRLHAQGEWGRQA